MFIIIKIQQFLAGVVGRYALLYGLELYSSDALFQGI